MCSIRRSVSAAAANAIGPKTTDATARAKLNDVNAVWPKGFIGLGRGVGRAGIR